MYYVKERLSDTAALMVEIHDDNVFCTCPGCGCEVEIDLVDLFGDGDGDLYGTSVYCPDCSMKRMEGIR